MDNFASLKGKAALVTGAAGGIGAACARELAAAGASVMLSDINVADCERLSRSLNASGATTFFSAQDVTSEEDWARVVDATLANCGGLDVLVNNAGIYVGGTLDSNTLANVRRVNQINVESVFLGMKYAALAMKPGGAAGKGGSIINLSSVAGLIGVPGHTAYGASKGAVRLYTKHAAVEFARLGYGIRVNSIHPGLIDTDMGRLVFDDFVEVGLAPDLAAAEAAVLEMIPMAALGTAEDVARMTRFLASAESGYCTGAEFVVDGGMTAA
ncbi:MAG: SDR family oxidoreductase [Halieaceae bacterium]|nr:SDR family oxidoreductase [Halieaceae bacterium]